MRSFYHDKKHQIRLWRAIGHETGEAIAFWFGTREHENLDRLRNCLTRSAQGRSIRPATIRITNGFHRRFWLLRRKTRKRQSGNICRYGRGVCG
jgi:IS1 family transposase